MTTSDLPASESAAKPAKKKHSPLLSLLAIALAIVGGVLIGYSFLTGITSELDPKVAHNSLYIALFFIGLGFAVEEGEFSQPGGEGIEVEFRLLKYGGIGLEGDGGSSMV